MWLRIAYVIRIILVWRLQNYCLEARVLLSFELHFFSLVGLNWVIVKSRVLVLKTVCGDDCYKVKSKNNANNTIRSLTNSIIIEVKLINLEKGLG